MVPPRGPARLRHSLPARPAAARTGIRKSIFGGCSGGSSGKKTDFESKLWFLTVKKKLVLGTRQLRWPRAGLHRCCL